MGASAISANLVNRLSGIGSLEANRLVERFQSGQITEKQFIASASSFLSLTRADSGAALSRSARLFGPSGVSYDPRAMALINDIGGSDLAIRNRGADVSAMEGIIA